MICKWCNKEVDNNTKFCPNCGGNLIETGVQEPIIQQPENTFAIPTPEITPAQPTAPIQQQVAQNEKANIGLVILSCLIPLAGLIIFLVKKDEDKKTAKASGIAALISFGVSILIFIISIVMITISTKKVIDNVIDNSQDIIDNNIIDNDNDTIEDNIIDEDNNIEDSPNNILTDTEWKNYKFVVNNKTISLPCTYAELSNATSSEMQSSYTKSYLQSGYYALINLYKNDKLSLYIEMLNDTDQDILYTDAKITRVSQTKYQTSVGADIITFPGGLKVGQKITKDELVNLFGEPSDVYNYSSDGYVSDKYSYYELSTYTTINYYQIDVVNGVIDQLTLDNRNYK